MQDSHVEDHVHKREYIEYGYTRTLEWPKIMDVLKKKLFSFFL